MSNNLTSLTNTLATIRQARTGQATPWLRDAQDAALNRIIDNGFPSTRQENWKYTDVRKLAEAYPRWLENRPKPVADGQRQTIDLENALHLVFVDGQFNREASSESLPAGLFAGSLEEIAATQPELLQNHLQRLEAVADSPFVALNTAFGESAVLLLVADGAVIDQPVYIEHFSATDELSAQTRLIVDLGRNSQVSIFEHFASNAAVITNSLAEFCCREGSRLTYCKLQQEHTSAWHVANQYVRLDRDATALTTTVDAGALLARNELNIELAESGAHASSNGLLLADNDRHVESRINVHHAAPDTTSRERYRSVLSDRARGVFNGRILVDSEAQKTAAELTNRNLLLSTGAEINTKPELEIYADDVKCAHGATTGQLDERSLFYLLTRGIDLQSARNMLVRAFASELVADIAVPAVAERTGELLTEIRYTPS